MNLTTSKGLFWFANDLRLHDQPALMQAVSEVEALLCVYVIAPRIFTANRFGLNGVSEKRLIFLKQSLFDLNLRLTELGHTLLVIEQDSVDVISELITEYDIDAVYRSQNAGWYENQAWQILSDKHQGVRFEEHVSHTLFSEDQLPFPINELPSTFTQFRKLIESGVSNKSAPAIQRVSFLPTMLTDRVTFPDWQLTDSYPFQGGETAALKHVDDYFSGDLPLSYKDVRNRIDGWDNSSKFSPWLANGCLSVRELVSEISDFEQRKTANDSTYWLYFELLWREYFQWYAHRYRARLFAFNGIKTEKPLTSFYPARFKQWCHGNTLYPIVNAGMKELNETGYLSNRMRQIVASCLVNELSLDWRCGATYFEQQLLDYDVASNWGNWQYLAGVGADSRDKRHFNLDKQTQMFDPDLRYINAWQGDLNMLPADHVDAADWPISE